VASKKYKELFELYLSLPADKRRVLEPKLAFLKQSLLKSEYMKRDKRLFK
jgi:hypothetical protein